MRSGIDIPSCQFDRNRATISGNQVLCASPEGIFLSSPPQPCTLILPLSFYSRELAPVNTEFGLAELCASRRCEYWPPLCRGGTTIAGRPPAQIRTGAFTHTALTRMGGGEARVGIRMQHTGLRNPPVQERVETTSASCPLAATD